MLEDADEPAAKVERLKRAPPNDEAKGIEFWKERAEAAERRARFAELRMRALEAKEQTTSSYLARPIQRSVIAMLYGRLRRLPWYLKSELKSAAIKVRRKIIYRKWNA